jgi:5-(carboxyamino)imidazole ribonucleotide synthase
MSNSVILPGASLGAKLVTTLGVLGGGQLGRMFIHAAQSMGYNTVVLDPDDASPAGLVSHDHIQTAYLDPAGLAELSSRCAAITTEFENVPASALQALSLKCPVSPSAASVAIAQDRVAEKAHFVACAAKNGEDAITVAPYAVIETADQAAAVPADLLPGILKTARMGYDGKGQIRVKTLDELTSAFAELGGVTCVLEKMLPLKAEYSVILARGRDGQVVHFPPQLNVHVDGILATTAVYPGNMPEPSVKRAIDAAISVANELQYVGVLCVELFLLHDDSLVVNEIAPRPHNSGHYTINACDVSQFELQVRTLCGLPLTQPRQHSPAIMLNILGDVWFNHSEKNGSTESQTPPWDQILALPGAHLHLYGKKDAKKGRKMGHLTITGATVEAVQATTAQAAQILGITKY